MSNEHRAEFTQAMIAARKAELESLLAELRQRNVAELQQCSDPARRVGGILVAVGIAGAVSMVERRIKELEDQV